MLYQESSQLPDWRMRIRESPAAVSLIYAAFASAWIVVSSALLDFTAADRAWQGRIELAKGLAFVAVTSMILYLLLRSLAKREPAPDLDRKSVV